jgi:CMP-N,N'-diacetyllegionaminic acid synthase
MKNKLNNKKYLCIIPARSGSKGIPNKNIILLNGHPLISYVIKAVLKSNIFDRVLVSTDSKEISDISIKYGADVPFYRDDYLATDEALVQDVISDVICKIEERGEVYDYICLVQPTSPLLIADDIHNVVNLLQKNKADMVISVCETPFNANWCGSLFKDLSMKNFFKENISRTRRQNFKKTYVLNGAIYIGKRDMFYYKKDYYKENTYAYIMPQERSVDIDSWFDLKISSYLLRELKK